MSQNDAERRIRPAWWKEWAPVASAFMLPFAAIAAGFAWHLFWDAFNQMQTNIQDIQVKMAGSVERGIATRVELGRISVRLERVEARVDRLQERQP